MKNIIKKYSHAWTFLYILIYFPWFTYLEKTVTTDFNLIYTPADDKIPFIPVFIIPYLLWFAFVAATVVYLFFYSRDEYYHCCAFLFSGMTLFLIISTVYPNGLNLRETIVFDNSIFSDLVKTLHDTDTSTNVFPSIHVFNSIGCMIALFKSKGLEKKYILKSLIAILTVSIILSTVFLKQHSIIDVIGAFVMAAILYLIVYVPKWGSSVKAK